jgi:hypothetical protein
MRSTISLLMVFTLSCSVYAQQNNNDFSSWLWVQAKYNLNKKTFINGQYQCRFSDNASTFDKSNLFLSVERKLTRSWNSELLYKFTTNARSDQHTLYFGLTYKLKFRSFIFYYRTAWQHKRNFFSGITALDDPYNEWRNRFRLTYPLGERWTFALSSEPYLAFYNSQIFFSRIRNVAQASYSLNKFHSLSLFYLVEPTLNRAFSNGNDFVAGITYQVSIPGKVKDLKEFFNFRSEGEESQDKKDTFN